MTYTNSTWSSWQLMNAQPTFSDTGWLPLVLSNGVQPYSTGYTQCWLITTGCNFKIQRRS